MIVACIGLLVFILILLGFFFAVYFGDVGPSSPVYGGHDGGHRYRQQQYDGGYNGQIEL